jgi:glycosyltransferase involved in cell wall biosynthesis
MMDKPIVSIIVPVFNIENYISKCLDSLLIQTLKEIEIILVDDGSTDLSGNICCEYASKDNRIRVIHKKNEGLSSARNDGLAIAKGEYIGFVDGDDWVKEDMFEFLYNTSSTHNADISICGHFIVDGDHVEPIRNNGDIKILNHIEALSAILLDAEINSFAWDKLYKRELFIDLSYPVGRRFEDIAFTYLIFNRSKRVVQANVSKYFYVRRNGSICIQINPLNQLHSFYGFHERYLFAQNKSEIHEILPIIQKKSVDQGICAINILLSLKNYPNRKLFISEFCTKYALYKDAKHRNIGTTNYLKMNLVIRIPSVYKFLFTVYHMFKN